MTTGISVEQLTNIICQISDQHGINKDDLLCLIPKNKMDNSTSQSNSSKKKIENQCFALVSDGTRCTKKSKNKISCLCGIHENALEKNGKLPHGRFDSDSQSNDLTSVSGTQKLANSDSKAKVKTNQKSMKNNKKINAETYLEDSDDQISDSNNSELTKTEISPTSILNSEVQKSTLNLINEKNYMDQTRLKKMIKDQIFKNETISSNFKKNNKVVIDSINTYLLKRVEFFENEAKKEFNKLDLANDILSNDSNDESEYDDDDNDSNQSDTEKIECTKITVKGKDYLMDENTNIIYHIETHVELGRFNNGLVVFD